jgi:ABC-type molybdenum transport system ATPase subunit/photorepair protein PhrA
LRQRGGQRDGGMRSSCALSPPVTQMDLSIVVRDLSFRHQNGASALDNISFSVKPGSRVLLIGSNGAGKVRYHTRKL